MTRIADALNRTNAQAASREIRSFLFRERARSTCAAATMLLLAATVVLGVIDHGGEWTRTWLHAQWMASAAAVFGLGYRTAASLPVVPSGRALLPTIGLAALSLYGFLQIVPLPFEWVAEISPTVLELSQSTGLAIDGKTLPLSVDPSMTRTSAAMLVVLAACSFAAACIADHPRFVPRTLVFLSSFGAVVSLDGVLRKTTHIPAIYLGDDFGDGMRRAAFSFFAHRNDAGYFLLLCIAAGVGLLWTGFRRPITASGPAKTRFRTRKFDVPTPVVFAAASLVLMATAILACGSRGALLGLAAAVLVAVLLAVPIRFLPRTIGGIALAGIVLWGLAAFGFVPYWSVERLSDTNLGVNPLSPRWR